MQWQPCLICKEDTANYCKVCARTSSDGSSIDARFYCDTDCRNKDEVQHLKVHMRMKQNMSPYIERAIRAGQIIESLFYTFVENTWTYDMKQVCIRRDQDGELVEVEVIDGTGVVTAPGGYTDCQSYAGGWLVKFPLQAFDTGNEDAKHALLTDRNSTWAFIVIHAAVQALFQDLVDDVETDVKEVVHYPIERVARIVQTHGAYGYASRRHDQLYLDNDEHGDTKSVYEITLKCGSVVALDLAGAQWDLQDSNGSHRPVTSWSDYCSRWVAAIKYRVPFRSHALNHSAKISSYRMITSQTLIMEIGLYFSVFMSSACKVELGFHPDELLAIDSTAYHDAKKLFFNKVKEYLQKRPNDLDNGNSQNVFNEFDIRHPKVIADAPKPNRKSNSSLPLDVGNMTQFDWKTFSRLILQPGSDVSFKEKKLAKTLQKNRSVYKEPHTWQLLFLEDTLPAPRIPTACVSENPDWKFR